jgi:hypothetical protein
MGVSPFEISFLIVHQDKNPDNVQKKRENALPRSYGGGTGV